MPERSRFPPPSHAKQDIPCVAWKIKSAHDYVIPSNPVFMEHLLSKTWVNDGYLWVQGDCERGRSLCVHVCVRERQCA